MGILFSPFALTLLAVGVVLIVLLVIAVKLFGGWGQMQNQRPGESALEALKKRYACGEISKDEYEEMKRVLS